MSDRPGYHFALPRGHLNDPLGVTWHRAGDGDRYELFFQLNPHGPAWAPDCRWGQAHGRDLVRWEQPRTALEPAAGAGCWSGAVAVPDDGTPVIVYTSVDVDAPDLGRIALARGSAGWDRWTAEGPVLDPPPDLDLHTFRDPAVRRDGDGWRMLVGAGSRDGRAMALQYSSPDLRHWSLDGPVAERPATATGPATGSAWECPQLFPLDGAWVLLVSAWDRAPLRVLAAVGDFDGRRFTARSWQPFDASGELYATTAFRDAEGRWCALSWLPGEPGMFSLPHLLALDGDRLRVAPHPDVEPLVGTPLDGTDGALPSLLDVTVPEGCAVTIRAADGGELLRVDWPGSGPRLLRPACPDTALPAGQLRLLLDAGIAEAFAGGGVAALRLAATGSLRLDAADGVVVRPVQRWFSR